MAGGCSSRSDAAAGDEASPGARYLTITDRPGYTEVIVSDPWNAGGALGRYALVERGAVADVPDSLEVIRVPLERAVVYSMVHTAAFDELGAGDAVAGIADLNYYPPEDPVVARVEAGTVADVGSSMAPNVERIIELVPDAIILSPYENSTPGAVTGAGIPLLYMADYMETTPTARAEWIRLAGALTGRRAMADSIYRAVVAEYDSLRHVAAGAASRPVVITERPYSGVWYVPGGNSYKAALLADAGADYPWADDPSTGSLQLSEEAVIARAAGATMWLLNESAETTAGMLLANMPHAAAFSAFPDGVYYCNTVARPLFRDIAFHPERVLRDMVHLFHPELRGDSLPRYYEPLKK